MCCSWLLSALGGWYLRFQGFWGYWHAKANGTGKPIRLCCTCVINAWDFFAFSTCFKRSTLLSKQSLSFSIYLYHLLHRKLTIPWKSMVKEDDSFLFDILNPFFRGGDIHFIIFFGWGGWYSSGFINIYIYQLWGIPGSWTSECLLLQLCNYLEWNLATILESLEWVENSRFGISKCGGNECVP